MKKLVSQTVSISQPKIDSSNLKAEVVKQTDILLMNNSNSLHKEESEILSDESENILYSDNQPRNIHTNLAERTSPSRRNIVIRQIPPKPNVQF